ncbi:DHH family phosphoesterase [Facklamia sp. P12945]|uniref:DHH family phosphoesterase n=1 Tax=unclassified Facklamia TaxID=2622293 RepID=UPI003D183017
MFKKIKLKEFFDYFHSLQISWQIYSILLIYIVLIGVAFKLEWRIGVLLLIFLSIIILFFTFNIKGFIKDLTKMASHMSENASLAQEYALYNAPIGVILYDQEERVTWTNPAIKKIFEQDIIGEKIEKVDGKLTQILGQSNMSQWQEVSLTNGYYRALHHHEYKALYLYDITQDIEIQKVIGESILVMGSLLLDDFDDLIYAMDDEASAKFESDLISRLNRWADHYQIYLKQTDEDQFLLLLNESSLNELEKEKFESIEAIKEYYTSRKIPISLSLAFSYSRNTQQNIIEVSKQVKSNLDLALGRGGDQVVIREIEGKARFYGAKTSFTENRSDIRSKMFFQALKSTVLTYDRILISGHQSPDLDSIGSALAVRQIVKSFDRQAKILIDRDELNQDIKGIINNEYFEKSDEEVFIEEADLDNYLNEKTLLILVDHHRAMISQAESIFFDYDIVIIDHHRQAEEFPKNCVLSYLEPSASSAVELLTEYFSVMDEKENAIDEMLATVMLAGIIIDTNQFSLRTGSRTFEAAAYLKSMGADNIKIKHLLKESLESIKIKNRLIENTEIIDKVFAVTVTDEDIVVDNVLASQTADDLLGIDQIEASFVIYKRHENEIGISARSLGKINVQVIMEKLGGGGHLSNAATQIKDQTIQEVEEQLIKVINVKED